MLEMLHKLMLVEGVDTLLLCKILFGTCTIYAFLY
jgi:hypothetical protein